MRGMLRIACWAGGLWIVTLGLGFLGWIIDPWIGEMGSGEHPLLLFGVPMLVCVIVLSGLDIPAWLAFLAGGVAQFAVCLFVVGVLWLVYVLLRRVLT